MPPASPSSPSIILTALVIKITHIDISIAENVGISFPISSDEK